MMLALAPARSLAASGGADATGWSGSGHSAARLLAGGKRGDDLLAGVAVTLDPGYLTYWRIPGDAGVPPTFDASGSDNVASVTAAFPAPRKLDEGGVEAFGYHDSVVFPLHVIARDPSRPVTLALAFSYAVCATQCLPAGARFRLTLPNEVSPDARTIMEQALAAVPRETILGAPGPVAVERVVAGTIDGRPGLTITARASDRSALFVEAPEGWYWQAKAPRAAGDGTVVFAATALDHPNDGALDLAAVHLTLVDPAGAVTVAAGARAAP